MPGFFFWPFIELRGRHRVGRCQGTLAAALRDSGGTPEIDGNGRSYSAM